MSEKPIETRHLALYIFEEKEKLAIRSKNGFDSHFDNIVSLGQKRALNKLVKHFHLEDWMEYFKKCK